MVRIGDIFTPAPMIMAMAGVVALTIATASALAMSATASFAVSKGGGGGDESGRGGSGFGIADARIQCNTGWVYDARKQHCVRAKSIKAKPPRAKSGPRASSPPKRSIPQATGTRTLCVRTCDGYYFPISHSATRKRFKIDEAVCKAMYGGADANLFVHDNGSPADTAVSLKGKPLAREPYAFGFRNTFNETCHAELRSGLTRLGAAFVAKAAKASPAPGPKDRDGAPTPLSHPAPRVIAGTDPETLANRTGSFLVAPVLSPDEAAIVASASMRKVGAAYYYDDPTVIDTLRDPPPRGPEFTLIGSALADQPETKSDIRRLAPGSKSSTTSLSPGQF